MFSASCRDCRSQRERERVSRKQLNVGRQMADKPPATETTAPQPDLAGEKSIGEDANVGIILSLMESANQPEAAVRP